MKKYLKHIAISFSVILLAAIFGIYERGTFGARPAGVSVNYCQTASTTPTYIAAGTGTSTCVIDVSHAKGVDLNFMATASSSASELHFSLFYTTDDVVSSRNWFGERGSLTPIRADQRTYSSSTPDNIVPLTSTTASTTYFTIPLRDIQANYLKVQYGFLGANGAVYLEVPRDND